MNAPRRQDKVLLVLVGLGALIMAGLAGWGFLRGPGGLTGERPGKGAGMVQVERRAVPNLTADDIRHADLSTREAMYYEKLPGGKVRCTLCPFLCELAEGERGQCRTRINLGGVLRTLIYGRLVAVHNDPIEKKPIFHYLPASRSLSIATAGCNLGCVFCQNWQISQALPETATHTVATPEDVVAAARRNGCKTIAFTYTEPTVFYEFMLDTARLARKEGIRSVWITCGYINPDPLRELCKTIDAANIDVKGFSERFYREYCAAQMEPVLTALRIAKEEGVWVEVTNLLVPGGNDDPQMIRDLCKWHMANLGPDVPVHFSRFFPFYRMLDKPPTAPDTLETAARIAREQGLRYVYIGNIATAAGEDTVCPKCGRTLIKRRGFDVLSNSLRNGSCPACGTKIAGVWSEAEDRKTGD